MIFNGIALAVGALILVVGLYYLIKEKKDRESRKIYGIVSGAGALIFVGFLVKIILELM